MPGGRRRRSRPRARTRCPPPRAPCGRNDAGERRQDPCPGRRRGRGPSRPSFAFAAPWRALNLARRSSTRKAEPRPSRRRSALDAVRAGGTVVAGDRSAVTGLADARADARHAGGGASRAPALAGRRHPMSALTVTAPAGDADERPTDSLPLGQLVRLSLYWLGLSSIFAGLSAILAGRLEFERLVPAGTEGSALFQMTVFGAVIAAIVQPTVGSLSDYTVSRWGRRKPYIVVGSILDIAFLVGIATCLLYTSDAADEEDSVDLGGR